MNNIYDFKSKIKFLNHINKINSFFLNLKNINFNVNIKNQIILFENLKNDIIKFLSLLEYYNLSLSLNDFKYIYLIKYNSEEILSINNKNTQNLINYTEQIINHIDNFDSYDNFCLLKTLNRLNRFKYELLKFKENTKFDLLTDIKSKNELQKHNLKKQKNDELYSFKNSEFIKNQFWILLENDLKFYPPNIENLLLVFDKIVSIIFTLLKNDTGMYIEIEKNINIMELKKKFDTFYFINGLDYLLQILKSFHDKKYDNLSNSKQKILKNAMIDGTRLDKFVPDITKYLLDGFYTVLIEKNKN